MKINANFEERAAVHTANMPWEPSPMAGVSRRMLDRVGDEVARATSIVRYDPGSQFSPHVHSGGEEFLVLDGIFQDEHGDFPVGTYVRNPINTKHTPASEQGCEIFVKLWQFESSESDILRVDTNNLDLQTTADNSGVSSATLFENSEETVAIQNWSPGTEVRLRHNGGMEVLVIEGSFKLDNTVFSRHSWLRLPNDENAIAKAGQAGARIWTKQGHLLHIRSLPDSL